MAFPRTRLHPLIAAASVSVIIASLTASAVMTGVLRPVQAILPENAATAPVSPPAAATRSASTAPPATSGAAASGTTGSGGGGDGPAPAPAGVSETPPGSPVASRPPTPPAGKPRDPALASLDRRAQPAANPATLPAVFIHVYNTSARQQLQQLEPVLKQHGMRLAGIKVVGTGPAQSDLRYFHASERSEAVKVQAALLAAVFPVRQLKMISGYETQATPRQYELWLSPGFRMQR